MAAESEEAINNAMQLNLSRQLFTNTGCHFIGILSPKSKHLLTLPEKERTGGAFSDLLTEMENINFFKMFSNRTKESLAKTLKYVAHRADELLLAKGEMNEPPQALYILLSGVVMERYISNSDTTTTWPEKILCKGEFFGHVDIVHHRPPTLDAVTVCYSELLMLPKDNFNIVLKEIEVHTIRAERFLRSSEAICRFGWSEEELKILEIYLKICTYAKDQEVYSGGENNKSFWSYFVVSGVCKITRKLTYYFDDSGRMKNVPYQLRNELKVDKMITECVEFEELKQGHYFGVGENFIGNSVIANSTLECLVVPRLLLVFKNKILLNAMARDLSNSLPSDQEILDNYWMMVTASKEKVELFKDLFKHKPERLIKQYKKN